MARDYKPNSEFLRKLCKDEVVIDDTETGMRNLHYLIELTKDVDRTNRDWAVLLLAQQEADTAEIRRALTDAAKDDDLFVRGEAILGLAQRKAENAPELIGDELGNDTMSLQIVEAALMFPNAKFVDDLQSLAQGDDAIAEVAREALTACVRLR